MRKRWRNALAEIGRSSFKTLWSINAPPRGRWRGFYAGLVFYGGIVVRAAPIIGYMIGWTAGMVRRYCRRRGYKVIEV